MTPQQLARIDGAFEKMFNILAGDVWTYVSPSGEETDLTCIAYNLKLENKPGLLVDNVGMREQAVIELLFKKSWLDAANVTISVEGHWLYNDKRYDFAKNEEIMDMLNPVDGLQNLLSCRVRECAEINQTVPLELKDDEDTGWSFDLDAN